MRLDFLFDPYFVGDSEDAKNLRFYYDVAKKHGLRYFGIFTISPIREPGFWQISVIRTFKDTKDVVPGLIEIDKRFAEKDQITMLKYIMDTTRDFDTQFFRSSHDMVFDVLPPSEWMKLQNFMKERFNEGSHPSKYTFSLPKP